MAVFTRTLARALRRPEYAQVVPVLVEMTPDTPASAAGAELEAGWGVPLKNVLPELNMVSLYAPRALLDDLGRLRFVQRVHFNKPMFALEVGRRLFEPPKTAPPDALPREPMPPLALPDPLGLFPGARAGGDRARDEVVRYAAQGWVPTYEALKAVGALDLHDAGVTGRGVKVAVLDTGVDNMQVQLQGVVAAHAYVAGEGPEDSNGHGTHVITTVKGKDYVHPLTGLRVLGGAPDAEVSSYKVLGRVIGAGETDDILRAMGDAIAAGNKVISMSLGGELADADEEREDLMVRFIDWAAAEHPDVIFSVAAGNSGPDTRTIGTPAAAAGALTVGSISVIDGFERAAYFSSRGPTWGGLAKPDICGLGGGRATEGAKPSENIYSGTSLGTPIDASDKAVDGWAAIAGTSMATPQVSAILALWKQVTPQITARDAKGVFAKYGRPRSNDVGHGLIDARWLARAVT